MVPEVQEDIVHEKVEEEGLTDLLKAGDRDHAHKPEEIDGTVHLKEDRTMIIPQDRGGIDNDQHKQVLDPVIHFSIDDLIPEGEEEEKGNRFGIHLLN